EHDRVRGRRRPGRRPSPAGHDPHQLRLDGPGADCRAVVL
ncbi:MAG: hypothetical protein AVDCRST_MAG52-3007, partial [uncultured Blastococcus sp.]